MGNIYFAERNRGPWHNKFLTFASKPSFVNLLGSNLKEKVACIPNIVDNTNIEAAFNLVLETAINNKLSQADMPKAIVIISDMEFDDCAHLTNYETIQQAYKVSGYECPQVAFWNVNGRIKKYIYKRFFRLL